MAWNGSDSGVGNSTQSARDAKNAKPGGGGQPRSSALTMKGLVALAIVVVGGGLAWWWVGGRRASVPEVPEVAHVPSLKGQRTNDKGQTKAVALKRDPPETVATSAAIPAETNVVKRYGHSSNVPSSDPSRIRKAPPAGGMTVVGWDGKERVIKSKPIFKSRADNMLWAAVRPGGMPSGLNALRSRMRHQTGSDAAFLQALRTTDAADFAVSAGDPPNVRAAKETTKEVKERIVEEMDKGRSFDDIYREIQETTYKERMYERIAQAELRKLMSEGDAKAVREYVRDMNPVMEELGLKTLRVPSWAEEE